MEVLTAIRSRRAFRSLAPVDVTVDLVRDLAEAARLAPSCFNHQPWRFVFIFDPETLLRMRDALSGGNTWIHRASMIVAVFSRPEDDCIIRDRVYHQFDCGMAAAFLILRATELGLIAHPVAGFSPRKTAAVLGIPEDYKVITLINVGLKAEELNPVLSKKHIAWERKRPRRKALAEFVHIDRYGQPWPVPKGGGRP